MTRKTLYGTLTYDEVMNENEKAMLHIKECAELVGLEVIDGKTAFSITFMAEVMKRLREKQEPMLDKIRTEIKAMFTPSGTWMYEEGHEVEHAVCEVLSDVLKIIDEYKAESDPQESDLGDYPDAIHDQFDNLTGSMNM